MANELTYQSDFTGEQMDERFRAVATLAEALTVLEQAIAAKYTKPADGIPSTDMDASVQSALALALTSVQSLADYYTKSQVDSIAAAIAATVNATSGEVVASLPTASASTLGKIYYVGPTSGEYDRYVTSYDGTTYSWLQIGTTDVDMTQYATKAELSQLDQEITSTDFSSLTVQGAASYAEVLFGQVIPAGTVLSYFTQTANGYFYLTDESGGIEVATRSDALKNMLPYTTTKAYRGIKTQSAFDVTLGFMGEMRLDSARVQVFVGKTDSETLILDKFRYAYMRGNADVIFERGVYTLKEIYPFMKTALGWTWTMGLPVGNGCRYYGNGSIIKSEAPTGTYTDDRNIFDTKASGSTFEMYDFTLQMDGGTYCVHDESSGSATPYYHKYENITMIANGATTCIGTGTGFDTKMDITNCNFIMSGTTTVPIQTHAPTSNPDSNKVTFHLTIMGCYMNLGRPFTINENYIDTNRDDVTVKFANNSIAQDINSSTSNSITTYYNFNNVIRG